MNELKDALSATGYKFAHFGWSKAPAGDYGVYAEDNEIALYANNAHAERVTEGTIDYFTRDDSGTPKTTIEAKLDAANIMYRLESIQFEDETGYIHYEWVFEIG